MTNVDDKINELEEYIKKANLKILTLEDQIHEIEYDINQKTEELERLKEEQMVEWKEENDERGREWFSRAI